MTEPTAETNLRRLIELEGEMKTFKATVNGQMELQSQHVAQINKSAESMEKCVDAMATQCVNLTTNQAQHERDIAAIKVKVKSNETLCGTNKENLEDKIQSNTKNMEDKITNGFSNLKTVFETSLEAKEATAAAVADVEDKAEGKADADKKWRYGFYLTFFIAVVGWVIAWLF